MSEPLEALNELESIYLFTDRELEMCATIRAALLTDEERAVVEPTEAQ